MRHPKDSNGWHGNSRGEWYVIVQGLLVLLVLIGPAELPGLRRWGVPWAALTLVSAVVVGGAGLLLTALGVLGLGRRNLSPFPRPKEGSQLVETGAYAIVRHPIYSGVSLIALGWALARRSPLVLGYALMLFLFLDIKSRREEVWLRQKFPNYSGYQSRVKKLVPFLY
jgi:protein-S-isoprenylcysteine O-methyltransferase Ste14